MTFTSNNRPAIRNRASIRGFSGKTQREALLAALEKNEGSPATGRKPASMTERKPI